MRVRSVPQAPASPGPTADEKARRNERLMDPVPFIPACLLGLRRRASAAAGRTNLSALAKKGFLRDLRELRGKGFSYTSSRERHR